MSEPHRLPALHWQRIETAGHVPPEPENFRLERLPVPEKVRLERAQTHAVARALAAHGVPVVEAGTALSVAVGLLQHAAAVEHALMVQYLYALFSLHNEPVYEEEFLMLALEEMGHLMTVQNVLMALGEEPCLSRPATPSDPDLDPFTLVLERLSKASLAKYVAAEMPDLSAVPAADREAVQRALELTRQRSADHRVNRAGAVYATVYWLLQASDLSEGPLKIDSATTAALARKYWQGHVRDSDFQPAKTSRRRQALSSDWSGTQAPRIHAAATRAEALAAVHDVMCEGEGPTSAKGSHFSRVLARFRDSERRAPAIFNVPTNPVQAIAEHGREYVRLWSELFDRRYEIMLLSSTLWLSYRRTEWEGPWRRQFAAWTIQDMTDTMRVVAQALTRMPLRTAAGAGSGRCAGPTFSLPPPFPSDRRARVQHLRQLIAACETLLARIRSHADFDPLDDRELARVAEIDRARRAQLDAPQFVIV